MVFRVVTTGGTLTRVTLLGYGTEEVSKERDYHQDRPIGFNENGDQLRTGIKRTGVDSTVSFVVLGTIQCTVQQTGRVSNNDYPRV